MPVSRQTPSRRGPNHWGQSSARTAEEPHTSATKVTANQPREPSNQGRLLRSKNRVMKDLPVRTVLRLYEADPLIPNPSPRMGEGDNGCRIINLLCPFLGQFFRRSRFQ